jgi:two-component system nitrogen regulation response regulator GlnG
MAHLLVVDDEQSICWGLSQLAAAMGHTVATAASAEAGLESAQAQPPDVIVLDVRLPGMDGLTAMHRFQEFLEQTPIIVVTAYGELSTAVAAVRNGAFDYLTKPFDLQVVQRAIQRALRPVARRGPDTAPSPGKTAGGQIVGTSAAMQEVFKRIALVAPSDACVHLHGESGTGKELVARAIHRYSRRSDGPFVAVNVASLSPSLAESELFGHARGAFTGADQARKGLLEQADGGTIFLDEVADIPLALQVKLLRTLEHGEVLPVGAQRPVQSDFRIISATHQQLGDRLSDGSFRHDLYFRLVTFEIDLPPLRQRRDDIRPLAEHFTELLAAKNGWPQSALSEAAVAALEARPWYGNVRELRNAIEHALVLARGGVIAPEHLPPPSPPAMTTGAVGEEALAQMVRQWTELQLQGAEKEAANLYERLLSIVEPPLLETVLRHHGGQRLAAAEQLGLHRATLRKKLEGRKAMDS